MPNVCGKKVRIQRNAVLGNCAGKSEKKCGPRNSLTPPGEGNHVSLSNPQKNCGLPWGRGVGTHKRGEHHKNHCNKVLCSPAMLWASRRAFSFWVVGSWFKSNPHFSLSTGGGGQVMWAASPRTFAGIHNYFEAVLSKQCSLSADLNCSLPKGSSFYCHPRKAETGGKNEMKSITHSSILSMIDKSKVLGIKKLKN